MKFYVVWNAAHTEGYATHDYKVAYAVSEGLDLTFFDIDGLQINLAQAFCEVISQEENCTIEQVDVLTRQ